MERGGGITKQLDEEDEGWNEITLLDSCKLHVAGFYDVEKRGFGCDDEGVRT